MSKMLLVEGDSDKELFENFCQYHNLKIKKDNIKTFEIVAPKDVDKEKGYNSKQGIINLLDKLLPQIRTKSIERLGIIVDADFVDTGTGFCRTHEQIAEKLAQYDYKLNVNAKIATNKSKVILPDIGIWIMPNHSDDGAIEHWIKENIHQDEQGFYNYVDNIIKNIQNQKFKSSHQLKATIGTWLLWQKNPHWETRSLFDNTIDKLINRDNQSYQDLLAWFGQVFD